jgi:hypothetical protein
MAATAGLVALVVGGAVACRPGDLNSLAVANTTDWTATARLEQEHVDVSWLNCIGGDGTTGGGTAGSGGTAALPATTAASTPSSTQSTIVSVDCQGRTEDGRTIAVVGRVTKAVGGACVRGDLVARVAGEERFHVSGLGDCDATPWPTYQPPATYRPPGLPRPAPTVTVTVTRTLWCEADPRCGPVAGK